MMLEQFTSATHDTPATSATARSAVVRGRKTAQSLVLFIGVACEPTLAERDALARTGMKSLWLPSMAQALAAARSAQFDAVVVDTSMLDSNLATSLPRLCEGVDCPVVVLADRGDDIDEIIALELGADAFLFRPVVARRLRAHLQALLRWCGKAQHAARENTPSVPGTSDVQSHSWCLDRVGNRLLCDAGNVCLTEVQSALLQCLLEAQGRIVPRARLMACMPHGHPVGARSVDVYIHRLRKRLVDAGVRELDIQSVRGRGYALNAPH
jgi:DNA-binding response OmpR family regulator